MPKTYVRPLVELQPGPGAYRLAGGWAWFSEAELCNRDGAAERVPASALPEEILHRLTAPRAAVAGLSWDAPRVMGIVNVTPDSFSDGGLHFDAGAAARHAMRLADEGADILDIGGESTRPGAAEVDPEEELRRVIPVIEAVQAQDHGRPISIDTRKAAVARAAVKAGAGLVNDVSAMEHDPAMAGTVADLGAPVCLMHAQGTPEDMQRDPRYDHVLFDVYDALEERISSVCSKGILPQNIIADPGIGFGKKLEHNLALLRGLSLFHGLGCPVLLGVSRKRFIGTISGAGEGDARAPGSVAVALHAVQQGVQLLRVHDVKWTTQALTLWRATTQQEAPA